MPSKLSWPSVPQHDLRRWGSAKRSRRGLSTLYLILAAPLFVIFFCGAIELGNLWLARTELENALEAAALAGAHRWGNGGTTSEARTFAVQYAGANTIVGKTITLDPNEDTDETNGNATTTGQIVLGNVTGTTGSYSFEPDTAPSNGKFGVRVRHTFAVPSVCMPLFGVTVTMHDVTASVIAIFDDSNTDKSLKLIRL